MLTPRPLLRAALLSSDQIKRLERLDMIKASVASYCAKQDRKRIFDLLTAAGSGDDEVRLRGGQAGRGGGAASAWRRGGACSTGVVCCVSMRL